MIVIVALIGGAVPLIAKWQRKTIRLFISFGAGVLLGASFLHMIPEAADLIHDGIGLPLLFGFLSLYLFEKFIMVHACEAEDCNFHTVGLSALLGMSIHSFVTGVALGAGMLAPRLGLVVFLAVLLHKFPESFSLASILVHENYSRRKILGSVLVVALMVPLGAGLLILVLGKISSGVLGWLVAFSGGTFLHIAADDLLPEVHSASLNRKATLSIFLGGVLLMWVSHQFIA